MPYARELSPARFLLEIERASYTASSVYCRSSSTMRLSGSEHRTGPTASLDARCYEELMGEGTPGSWQRRKWQLTQEHGGASPINQLSNHCSEPGGRNRSKEIITPFSPCCLEHLRANTAKKHPRAEAAARPSGVPWRRHHRFCRVQSPTRHSDY